MALADTELRDLMLRLERQLVAQAHLRVLLTAAEATVRRQRALVRTLTARIKRAAPRSRSRRRVSPERQLV